MLKDLGSILDKIINYEISGIEAIKLEAKRILGSINFRSDVAAKMNTTNLGKKIGGFLVWLSIIVGGVLALPPLIEDYYAKKYVVIAQQISDSYHGIKSQLEKHPELPPPDEFSTYKEIKKFEDQSGNDEQ